jgi:MinD-like ATPase involved in chromosome partitioning or flagellar assembly
MSSIVSVHSFRGGTGKSNLTANLAAILAQRGRRVGVIDTDIQSPGIHILFGLDGGSVTHSLNDYLKGACTVGETAHPVLEGQVTGSVFLIPSSVRADDIVQILRQGYDIRLLTTAMRELIETLRLDVLMIDTHPGLNEETLFSLAISNATVIVMRPDRQDYEGTAVTVEVARSLEVPHLMMVVNKAPRNLDLDDLRTQVEQTFGCSVAAVLPHTDDMMMLASEGIFALRYPDHPLTRQLNVIADELVPG